MVTTSVKKIVDSNGFLGFCPYDMSPLNGWSSKKTGAQFILVANCKMCDKKYIHIDTGKTYVAKRGTPGAFCLDCGTKTEPFIRIHNVYYKEPNINFIDILRQVGSIVPYCPQCENPDKHGTPFIEHKEQTLQRLKRIEVMTEQNS
jgi:hypothetical protein